MKDFSIRDILESIVAGISDNDPTTVATLSIIGATTVYNLLWLVILLLPMLLTIQVISTRIGVVTKKGTIEIIKKYFGKYMAWIAMILVVVVNLFTLGADLSGGAAALLLLFPISLNIAIVILAIGVGLLLIFGTWELFQRILNYILLAFLGYALTLFVVHPNWREVLYHSVIPTFSFTKEYVTGTIALLGTTLTSYVYVWREIEEVEDRFPVIKLPAIELDTAIGIVATVFVIWAIIVSSGATLGVHHKTVQTAQDAAQVLKPLAGMFAAVLFSIGLLGSALLAVSVIMATTGYVFSEAFGLPGSLHDPVQKDIQFYAVIIGSLLIGIGISFWQNHPIQLLFLSSIIGGLGTPVLLIMLMLIAGSKKILGHYTLSPIFIVAGWITTGVVSVASILYVYSQFH